MSHALIDKRCTENCAKAQLTVDISRTVEAPIEEILFLSNFLAHNKHRTACNIACGPVCYFRLYSV